MGQKILKFKNRVLVVILNGNDLRISMTTIYTRKRPIYAVLIILIIVLGLLSRSKFISGWIYPYLGDSLYALLIFYIVGFIYQRRSTKQVVILTLLFCFFIEISQLYQANWINSIRKTKLGGLVLGFGFLWSDLVSYSIGALIGMLIENSFKRSLFGSK